MSEIFRVHWKATGEPVDDLQWIALNCDWAKDLMYCDMEGFAIESDGTLILVDECGMYRYPPEDLFYVVWSVNSDISVRRSEIPEEKG